MIVKIHVISKHKINAKIVSYSICKHSSNRYYTKSVILFTGNHDDLDKH